jgi:hypothetical protein
MMAYENLLFDVKDQVAPFTSGRPRAFIEKRPAKFQGR